MSLSNPKLRKAFADKQALKIITGLSNFDIHKIIQVAKAAEIGGATYLDIAANIDIVKAVKQITDLPICVSSIDPVELYKCASVGADIIEIGNFDIFYNKGINFSESQVLDLAKEVRVLLPNIDLCVTIPHIFTLSQQLCLASNLEDIGVDILQTEGMSTKFSNVHDNLQYLCQSITQSSSALSSTYILSSLVDIPVMTASGLNSLSAAIAACYGASGIGIGSAIISLENTYDMSIYIDEIVSSMHCQQLSTINQHSLVMQRSVFSSTSV
nr:hypothetical protein Ahn.pli.UK.pt_024 [Ahnfeltia plicata]